MSLLPAFDDDGTGLFGATASWVSSTSAKPSTNAKFTPEDFNFDFATFAGAASAADQHHYTGDSSLDALFTDFKFPSPSLPAPVVFDTGMPLAAVAAVDQQSSAQVMAAASADANALQLQVTPESAFTPTGSPHTTSAGYASPSTFQYSPTPGLTMCPTVTSTPAPRSNSRCSSRSSFSHPADVAAAERARLASTVVNGHAHLNHNGPVPKLKKLHLCPFDGCARATRTFRSNADLQRHIRSHRGERPYGCPAPNCGKAYGQQNKMVNHVRQQHPALLSCIEVGRSRSARRPGVATAAAVAAAALTGSGGLYPGIGGMMTPGLSAGASAASSVTASPVQTPGPGPAPTVQSSLSGHRHAPYHQPAHQALQLAQLTPNRRTTAQAAAPTGPLFCAVRPQQQHHHNRW
ncbi:hypothetical protein Q8F55_002213 [Vanrija albida]|uniref:C2H2-type domain-containing protein n=1 Tax=Vanrija albida TaxID=181172 RepID=A0ABR3Q9S1_9TREE